MPSFDPMPKHTPVSQWPPHLFKQAALFIKREGHAVVRFILLNDRNGFEFQDWRVDWDN